MLRRFSSGRGVWGAVLPPAALAAALALGGGEITDWPHFRGQARDGAAASKGLRTSWPETGPPILWRVNLGEGFSGISVVGQRLYTLFAKGDDEFVVALNAADGAELWRYRIDSKWRDRFGNGPRSTPTVVGDVLYALSARGTLAALRTADGGELWKRSLQETFGAEPPTWGFATSPLIDGDRLLLDVGGKDGSAVVAFESKTGVEIWRSQQDPAAYSTPLPITVGGLRQVVFFTGERVMSLRPDNGSLLWAVPWKTSYGVNAATPIFVAPDKLFVASGYDVGGALYRISVDGEKARATEIWKTRGMKNQYSSSVLHGGHLYGFDDKTLRCIDVADGETKWFARGFGHGSLILAAGHLIVLGDRGTLALIEATPEAYREKARTQPFDGKTWTGPTLVSGHLYLRDERELIALEVSD